MLVTQLCSTLCYSMDCSLPGFSKFMEWVAIHFSRGSSWPRDWTWVSHIAVRFSTIWSTRKKVKPLSRVSLFGIPSSVARHAPPSMGFSRQEYWSGLPFLPPGDLPNPEIKPRSPALKADSMLSEPPGKPPNRKIPPKLMTVLVHDIELKHLLKVSILNLKSRLISIS